MFSMFFMFCRLDGHFLGLCEVLAVTYAKRSLGFLKSLCQQRKTYFTPSEMQHCEEVVEIILLSVTSLHFGSTNKTNKPLLQFCHVL